jgi:hypothetical protein
MVAMDTEITERRIQVRVRREYIDPLPGCSYSFLYLGDAGVGVGLQVSKALYGNSLSYTDNALSI